MTGRRVMAAALALLALTGPFAPARAAGEDQAPDSKVGVVLAVACGFSLRNVTIAPVPWAGIALVSCAFAFLDAAMSPDKP